MEAKVKCTEYGIVILCVKIRGPGNRANVIIHSITANTEPDGSLTYPGFKGAAVFIVMEYAAFYEQVMCHIAHMTCS